MEESSTSEAPAVEEANDSPFEEDYRGYSGESENPEGESESEPILEVEKHEVKWGDVVENLTVEELKAAYQTRRASDENFRKSSAIEKQAEALLDRLKNDPISILENPELGINFRELAEDYLYNKIQYEQMDEDEKSNHDAREELEGLRQEKKKREDAEFQSQVDENTKAYNSEIISALEQSGIPKTPGSVRRIAQYMYNGHKANRAITAETAASLVKGDLIKEHKELYGGLKSEQLGDYFDPETLKRMRQYEIAKLKRTPEVEMAEIPAKKHKSKEISMSDWKRRNELFKQGLA